MSDRPSSAPSYDYKAVSADNGNALANYTGSANLVTRGISCAVAGVISIKNSNGDFVDVYIVAGAIHPISTNWIRATGTTATGLIVWW